MEESAREDYRTGLWTLDTEWGKGLGNGWMDGCGAVLRCAVLCCALMSSPACECNVSFGVR